jgi:hypothetical protein
MDDSVKDKENFESPLEDGADVSPLRSESCDLRLGFTFSYRANSTVYFAERWRTRSKSSRKPRKGSTGKIIAVIFDTKGQQVTATKDTLTETNTTGKDLRRNPDCTR